jgi:hypothetical protein
MIVGYISCLKLSNVTLHRLNVKKISKKYSMIVLMLGIAFVLFGTFRKRHVKTSGEKQIVGGFSKQYAIMDLLGLLLTSTANPLAGAA